MVVHFFFYGFGELGDGLASVPSYSDGDGDGSRWNQHHAAIPTNLSAVFLFANSAICICFVTMGMGDGTYSDDAVTAPSVMMRMGWSV